MSLQTIDMKSIRCLNLFSKITGVRTNNCFPYNNAIIFAVHPRLVSKAIGAGGENVKQLCNILQKKVKIVSLPKDVRGAEKFVADIVSPLSFKTLEIFKDDIIVNSNMQNKAALIGREKVRFLELSNIIKQFFGKNLRIV